MKKAIAIPLLFALSSFIYGQDPLYNRPNTGYSQDPVEQIDKRDFNLQLDRAMELQDTGSNLEVLGVALISASIVLSMRKFDEFATLDDIDNNRKAVIGLSIGGAVVFTAGFLIDLSGREKLIRVLKR